jgi:hypothetical protein
LRYRAQAPLIDGLLKEIGLDPTGAEHVTRSLMAQPDASASA